MVQKQVPPDISKVIVDHMVTAVIDVTVDPTGKATAFKVDQPSGNADFDQAAMQAAKDSTYLPKLVNCKPVAGEYLFNLSFDPKG